MERIEWAGVIGVGAVVVILFSGMPIIQYVAGILLVAGARPFYRAIKRTGITEGIAKGLSQAASIIRDRRGSS